MSNLKILKAAQSAKNSNIPKLKSASSTLRSTPHSLIHPVPGTDYNVDGAYLVIYLTSVTISSTPFRGSRWGKIIPNHLACRGRPFLSLGRKQLRLSHSRGTTAQPTEQQPTQVHQFVLAFASVWRLRQYFATNWLGLAGQITGRTKAGAEKEHVVDSVAVVSRDK